MMNIQQALAAAKADEAPAKEFVFNEPGEAAIHAAVKETCAGQDGRAILSITLALIHCREAKTDQVSTTDILRQLDTHQFCPISPSDLNVTLCLFRSGLLHSADRDQPLGGDVKYTLGSRGQQIIERMTEKE